MGAAIGLWFLSYFSYNKLCEHLVFVVLVVFGVFIVFSVVAEISANTRLSMYDLGKE